MKHLIYGHVNILASLPLRRRHITPLATLGCAITSGLNVILNTPLPDTPRADTESFSAILVGRFCRHFATPVAE